MAEPADLEVVVPIWDEERRLHGGHARVTARVAQPAGVGWIDLEVALPSHQMFQRRRLLADWAGSTQAQIVRAVISMADDWFAYCAEQAERERVVEALSNPNGPTVHERTAMERLVQVEMDRQLVEARAGDRLLSAARQRA